MEAGLENEPSEEIDELLNNQRPRRRKHAVHVAKPEI